MKSIKYLTSIVFFLFSGSKGISQEFIGTWSGSLVIQGTSLVLNFNFTKQDSILTATVDSPDQGAFGIPVSSVLVKKDSIFLDITAIRAKYEGVLLSSDTIFGQFSQANMILPLNVARSINAKKTELNRPQNPKEPFDYTIENVKFKNVKDTIQLAGTLTIPKGKGPFPAVVLISGSGPQNRDEEILGHKPFWVIADFLTRNGIAVLRYDDRGFAESEGNFDTATSLDFSYDAEAAFDYLKNVKKINKTKIGLIGHSEGGMIAPIIASRNNEVAFIILLAGPGIPIIDLMKLQGEMVAKSEGVDENQINTQSKINEKLFRILVEETDEERMKERIGKIVKLNFEELGIMDEQQIETETQSYISALVNPWFIYFMSFDPKDFLEKVKCPVLAINGDKDVQVTSKENLKAIKEILSKAGNTNFEIHEMPSLNHLFQHAETGAVSEYKTIEETFSEDVMKIMSNWILKR
jgi:uncharacterized protein